MHEDEPVDDDAAEFRAAIGPVRKLPETSEPPRAPRRRAAAAMRTADEAAALAESHRIDRAALSEAMGDTVAWRRDEVPPDVLRRLGQARFAVEDEIDLHGLDERAAEDVLRRFIAQAREAGHYCVRIVHGKGLHSPQRPVLRNMVERMLGQRADVLAYASAPPSQGGTGALLALLVKARRPSR